LITSSPGVFIMEALISAVAGDLISRFISFVAQNFCNHTQNENDHGRLEHVLLRIHTIVEEAEGRCITNQGMLLQLKMLIKDINNTPVASAGTRRSSAKLKGILESLETKIQDMREFVKLLVSCPRLPCQPYSTYLFMDRCMFGRYTEKEQVINFLVCNGTYDCPNLEILPILGPHRVGKKTVHACKDERVRNCFSNILFLKGDDLGNGKFAANLKNVVGAGSKIVLIGRTQEVARFGTAHPIWLKSLSQEEYWYYFKALAFGSMDPDERPRLASLAMQLATELKGSFLGAKILEDLLERNAPVDFPSAAFVGAQGQRCLISCWKLKKQKLQRMVGKRNRLELRETSE
ncbi:hypothetical protein BAE44_0022887, partial [Dichanthelium oligosanthes]